VDAGAGSLPTDDVGAGSLPTDDVGAGSLPTDEVGADSPADTGSPAAPPDEEALDPVDSCASAVVAAVEPVVALELVEAPNPVAAPPCSAVVTGA